jgi:hypothetical protein
MRLSRNIRSVYSCHVNIAEADHSQHYHSLHARGEKLEDALEAQGKDSIDMSVAAFRRSVSWN